MTPRKFKTRSVSRDRYGTYLKKAQEFLRASEAAQLRGDWNAVGLNAVHSAISAADALLVNFGGIRSASDSHHDVTGLLEQHVRDEQISSKAKSLSKIMAYKNVSAYEDREISESEARDISKSARRFLEWTESRLSTGGTL